MFKKIIDWAIYHQQILGYGITAAFVIGILYLFRLGSHVRGDNFYESIQGLQINGIVQIFENVSYGPIKILELIMIKIDQPNATLLRIASALAVIAAIVMFFFVVSKWHTYRIALLAAILFGTSSFSLHLGRFSNQDALAYMIVPGIILIGTWLKSKKYVSRLSISLPAAAIFLYIPGFIYIAGLLGIIFRKRLKLAWRFVSLRSRLISVSSSILLLVPLFYSLIRYPAQLADFLAVDRLAHFNAKTILDSGLNMADALFYRGLDNPAYWLPGTPILDVASICLLVLGIYAYFKGPHTLRLRLIGLLAGSIIILLLTGSFVSLALLVPLIYLVIANGIAYMLQSWFTVFPKNPAARSTGLVLIVLLVGLISSYHLQRYFIAWPNAPKTVESLSVPLEKVIQ